jgi:hypothetical protein
LDTYGEVHKAAKVAHDTKTLEQLSFISMLAGLAAPLAEWWKECAGATETPMMTVHAQEMISNVRQHVKAVQEFTGANKSILNSIFLRVDGLACHCGGVDMAFKQPSLLLGALAGEAGALLSRLLSSWAGQVQSQTAELASFCMAGWQVCKHDICTHLRKDVREGLLKNASFMKIGPVVASLESAVSIFKKMYADGCGAAIDVQLLAAARQAIANGVDTVTTTFALFQIYLKIPKEPLVTVRRDLLKALREQMRAKGCSTAGSMNERMLQLASPAFSLEADA